MAFWMSARSFKDSTCPLNRVSLNFGSIRIYSTFPSACEPEVISNKEGYTASEPFKNFG